ncbi:Peptidase M50B-like [Georgenia satyanarayanai]|uniref:Peptidase M50B-like n=1 Tax=Georgenia satyanarayanai TaxID=860221 RepID=A0A2Y9AHU9_9MICO|nr:M50 family metallopeptidase [Georgenia satyanarayanai]PYF99062.1 peptidase M50B-like protein [Georgenia satyanarayanai]SSA44024.1 Peptidase M50B-like [Georgenia satyanarayanai]
MDLTAVLARLRPGAALAELGVADAAVWAALAAGLLVVGVRPLWRVLRVVVTVVHELGHAVVGVLVGRSFTGLVLRPDMSGHAVTVGRSRGPGRVATTWAGYPAPAIVGLALVLAGTSGWSGAATFVVALLLLLALLRSRSVYTGLVMVAALGLAAWLWWAADERVRGLALLTVGVVLLLGAWRHLGAVLRAPDRGSDPAVLARLTRVPAALWVLSFAAVLAVSSWLAAGRLWELVR